MIRGRPLALLLAVLTTAGRADAGPPQAAPTTTPTPDTVVEIRIHGNYVTPDAEVLRLAGITVGDPLVDGAPDQIANRLRASGRFEDVEVRKRYRSLAATNEVVLVLLVRERPTPMKGPLITRVPQMLSRRFLFLPILNWSDGYGFTYGARATFADVLGRRGRVSVPLTWGGTKRAGLEVDKSFRAGFVDRLQTGAAISQRENQFYRLDDQRRELWLRADGSLARDVRLGGHLEWSDVTFDDLDDRFTAIGATITYDTRRNPIFPRNAVLASAGWEVLNFERAPTVQRYRLDARGYVGLIGQVVGSLRVLYDAADRPLPPYEQALLGGASTLRGFRPGSFAGDRLLASSVELRMPIDSPMDVGQSGLKVFVDSGTVASVGESLRAARFHHGIGAGWFVIAPVFQLNIDVAYGVDNRWRLHVMSGFQF